MNEDLLSRPTTAQSQRPSSSHCSFAAGDKLGEYTVVKRLGRGRFATVWEVLDGAKNSRAVKVFRMGRSIRPYYENEVSIHSKIFPPGSGGKVGGDSGTATNDTTRIMGWQGFFTHSLMVGSEPRDHPCIVFDLAGDHLGRILRGRKDEGLPVHVVRRFMRDILSGLAELHAAGIIHTDISPGNLLLAGSADPLSDSARLVIADLGSSCFDGDIWSRHVGTAGFIAPEIVLGKKYSTSADIWSAFVVCYEMITGDPLFDVFGEADIDYGPDVVDDIMGPIVSDNESDNETDSSRSSRCSEASAQQSSGSASSAKSSRTSSSSDESRSQESDSSGDEDDMDINYLHLLLIEKVLGPAPRAISSVGREFYNARGRLKYNPEISHRPISELLIVNYELNADECMETEEFLLMGLRWLADERCSAADALCHQYLSFA